MSEANQTDALLLAHFQKHEAEARAVVESARKQPVVPIADYITETRTIAEYARSVWEKGPEGAPALKVGRIKFAAERLDRLSSLVDGLQHANLLEISEMHPVADLKSKVARAQFLMNELETALEMVLDDDVHEPADDRLDAVQEATEDAGTRGASVGQVLLAWGRFARDEQTRLAVLDDFDPALIDEAIALGSALTAAKPLTPKRREELRGLRLGFYTLVHVEVLALREAANYAYRHHPDIRKKFTSALERNRRNQKRLEKRLAEAMQTTRATEAPATPTETPSP